MHIHRNSLIPLNSNQYVTIGTNEIVEVAAAADATCSFYLDALYEDLIKNNVITSECQWVEDLMSRPLLSASDMQIAQQACNNILSKVHCVKATNGAFEIHFTYNELFAFLGLESFDIIGSAVLASILGKKVVANTFASVGIKDIWGRLPRTIVDKIFQCNDIDFRCRVEGSPWLYTENVISFFATRLPASIYAEWTDSQKRQLIRLHLITKRGSSKKDSSYNFSMLTCGNFDIFFYQRSLERTCLYQYDAWGVSVKTSSHSMPIVSIYGHLMGGWQSLLMQVLGILSADDIATINMQGIFSLFCQYAKGRKPVSSDLEELFLARMRKLIESMPSASVLEKLTSAVASRLNYAGGSTICALNIAFFLEAYGAEDLIEVTAKALIFHQPDAAGLPRNMPVLQLLDNIFRISLTDKPSLPLAAFLEVFSHLLWAGRQSSMANADSAEAFPRTFGKRPIFMLAWPGQVCPMALILSNDLVAALKKIRAYFDNGPSNDVLNLLQQLFNYLLPAPVDHARLFQAANSYYMPLIAQEELGGIIDALLPMPFLLCQQLGFLLLCYEGRMQPSSRRFSCLIRQIPQVLAQEKSPDIRQYLFAHFCQYMARSPKMAAMSVHTKDFEIFYEFIGKKGVLAQDILRQLAQRFAPINFIDFAATASMAWVKSSAEMLIQHDYELGKQLIELMPPAYHHELLKALLLILEKSNDSYRKLSWIYFKLCTKQNDTATLMLLSKAGQLLLTKASNIQQIESSESSTHLLAIVHRLLIHVPAEGIDLLAVLENRRVFIGRFKQIIIDKSSNSPYAKSCIAKAELLVLWADKCAAKHEACHSSKLEERLELLFEGYSSTLPTDTQIKLRTHIISILLCVPHLSRNIIETIYVRREWLIGHYFSPAPNFPGLCSFLQMLQSWEIAAPLSQDAMGQLNAYLIYLSTQHEHADLIYDLLQMYQEMEGAQHLYQELLLHFMQAKDFTRADICLRKLADDKMCAQHIHACLQGHMQANHYVQAFDLLMFLIKWQPSLMSLQPLIGNMVASLANENPMSALQIIEHYPQMDVNEDVFHQLILGLVPHCLHLPHVPAAAKHSRPARARRPCKEGTPQKLLLGRIVSLIENYGLTSAACWKAVGEAIFKNKDALASDRVFPLFAVHFNSLPEGCQADALTCWWNLIHSASPRGPLFQYMLKNAQHLMAYLKAHTKSEELDLLLEHPIKVLLSLVDTCNEPDDNLIIIQAADIFSMHLTENPAVPRVSLLTAWMQMFIAVPDYESLKNFWNYASTVARAYVDNEDYVGIKDFQSLLELSFPYVVKLSPKKSNAIIFLLSSYIKAIQNVRHPQLFEPFFFLLIEIKSDEALPLALKCAFKAFPPTPLKTTQKRAYEGVHSLMARLLSCGQTSAMNILLHGKFFPAETYSFYRGSLLEMYLNDYKTNTHIGLIKEALSLYVESLTVLDTHPSALKPELTERAITLLVLLLTRFHRRSLFSEYLRIIIEQRAGATHGLWKLFSPFLAQTSDAFDALVSNNALKTPSLQGCILNDFFYLAVNAKNVKVNPFNNSCQNYLFSFLGCLTKKICDVVPLHKHEQTSIIIHVFVHTYFLILLDSSNPYLLAILESFYFCPYMEAAQLDIHGYEFLQKCRDTLFYKFIEAKCFDDKPEKLYYYALLSKDYFDRGYADILIDDQKKSEVATTLIIKMCEKNSGIYLYAAIKLLIQHQQRAFAESALSLGLCYKVIQSRILSLPNSTTKGILQALLDTALAAVPIKLSYGSTFIDEHFDKK